jgi:hypothetical protein
MTVGFMGESLTAFLLELEYGKNGLRVISFGDAEVEWDLFIFEAPEGTPFTRPTGIQVKTRSRESWWTYPTREEFLAAKKKLEDMGYDLWYSFIHYRYSNGHLYFGTYLVPASDIREEDFAMKREFGREKEMLKINDMRDRARLKFHSRSMNIENEAVADTSLEGQEGKEYDVPLGVATALAGNWGEDMTAFLLENEYKPQEMKVGCIGRGFWPYDLFIDHPIEGTPFSRQTAFSVKTISTESGCSKPSFEELSEARAVLDARGIHLWLAVLQCYYSDLSLGFGLYLIDSMALDRGDFVDVPGSQYRPDLLNAVRARKKAAVRLWTGDMKVDQEGS